MPLTRKFLSALGIEEDKADSIITAHTGTVQGIRDELAAVKDELAAAKSDAEKLPVVQKELSDLKAKVEADAKEREGKDYDALKQEFEQYRADQEAKEHKAELEAKFRELLKDMNVTEAGIAKILKWRGVADVELDESGKLANTRDLRKSIKEDWPEYIATENTQGANTATPPPNTGGRMTVDQIMAIKDDTERQTAIAQNLDLFGQ